MTVVSIARSLAPAAVALLSGCGTGGPALPPSLAEQIGLQETLSNAPLVEAAIARANGVLGPEIPFRLGAVWVDPPLASSKSVPVILVTRVEPTRGVCYVPLGTRYIVVDASEIPMLGTTLSGNFANGMKLDLERLLTICLLHEAGHIFYGDSGASALSPQADPYNNVMTTDKEIELRADRFAADQIRAAMAEQFPSGRFTAAAMLPVELQCVSFNLTGKRVIDNFGKSTLRPREVFLDDSYTHPNLELRMLLVNHYIAPSDQSANVLEQFQQGRQRAVQPYRLLDDSGEGR